MSAAVLDMTTGRWTPGRKEIVCLALIKRQTTVEAVCAEHDLSADEVRSWLTRFERFGRQGLATRKLQVVR